MYIINIDNFSYEELYKCFSPNLKKFLCITKGFHYIHILKDKTTNKTCWIFLKTDGLSEALMEWSKNKPKRK